MIMNTCDKIQFELATLDQGVPTPPKVREHMATCHQCRAFASSLDSQNQSMTELVLPTPSDWGWLVSKANESQLIEAPSLIPNPMVKKERNFGKIAVTVALAASLLVAAIGLIPWLPGTMRLGNKNDTVALKPEMEKPAAPAPPNATTAGTAVNPSSNYDLNVADKGAPAPKAENAPLATAETPTPQEKMARFAAPKGTDPLPAPAQLQSAEMAFGGLGSKPTEPPSFKKPAKDLPERAEPVAPATQSNRGVADARQNELLEAIPLPNIAPPLDLKVMDRFYNGIAPTSQQKVQFTLIMCQQSTADILNRAQAEMETSSGNRIALSNQRANQNSELARNQSQQSNQPGAKPGIGAKGEMSAPPGFSGGGLGGRGGNLGDQNSRDQKDALGQTQNGYFYKDNQSNRFFSVAPLKTPEEITKAYEDLITGQIPLLLAGLKSPSNKKDLDILLQYLKSSQKELNQLIDSNSKQPGWVLKVIELNKKGIAMIQGHNP